MANAKTKDDGHLDLVLTRYTKLPRALLWRCWTEPEHLMPWFCPLPWKTIDCEIDLRPGGIFRSTMLSPEGKEFPNTGCYLEVVKHERLVWTDALLPGYRPSEKPFITGDPDVRGSPGRHEIRRARSAQERCRPQEARGHGLRTGLGHGVGTAPRVCAEAEVIWFRHARA